MKTFDDQYKIPNRGYNRSEERREGWLDGEVATPWGFVCVYAQGNEFHSHHSRLDFIHNGVQYIRHFSGKRFTKRGIKTKAMQFAKEIVERNSINDR